jgi:cell division protein FtsB
MNKYLKWGIIGFQVVLIVSLVKGIEKSKHSRGRVESLLEEKQELGNQRAELLEKLEYVQGEDYLEKIARDELNLAKEGEVVVIVPEDSDQFSVISSQEEKTAKKTNWEKWLDVILGR